MSAASVEWYLAHGALPIIVTQTAHGRTVWTQGEMEDHIAALRQALDESREAQAEAVREYRQQRAVSP